MYLSCSLPFYIPGARGEGAFHLAQGQGHTSCKTARQYDFTKDIDPQLGWCEYEKLTDL